MCARYRELLFSLGLNAAASGGGSRKGLFFCVRGGGVGVPQGVAECGSPRVGQISKESCRFGVPVLRLRLGRPFRGPGSWVGYALFKMPRS